MLLNICAIDDPKKPSTWSGTPHNIYEELKIRNVAGAAFASGKNDFWFKGLKYLTKKYYNTELGAARGKLVRYIVSDKVKRLIDVSGSKHTLHFGTTDLPFCKKPRDQFHYIFCDTTWNLWISNATDINQYSKSIIAVADDLEHQAYQQADHIFSISNYVKDNLINYYNVDPSKVTVVGTGRGVIKPFFGEKNYHNGKILFAAKGRFKDKGGDLVIEGFKKALLKIPDLELTIVGQNEYTGTINHPNISTHGFLPIGELQEMFNTHSLFLMPAINEPWGLVYLEALACKMPIVGLNRNSFPEISGFGKYGFGIDDTNADTLANVIVTAFAKTEVLEKMGLEGQCHSINNFTWEETVSKILEVAGNFKH